MNIVRLGHYFTPNSPLGAELSGGCQVGLVIKVWSDTLVNLKVWESDGDDVTRTSVPVEAPSATRSSFHLSGDCPWTR